MSKLFVGQLDRTLQQCILPSTTQYVATGQKDIMSKDILHCTVLKVHFAYVRHRGCMKTALNHLMQ